MQTANLNFMYMLLDSFQCQTTSCMTNHEMKFAQWSQAMGKSFHLPFRCHPWCWYESWCGFWGCQVYPLPQLIQFIRDLETRKVVVRVFVTVYCTSIATALKTPEDYLKVPFAYLLPPSACVNPQSGCFSLRRLQGF